MGNFLDSSSKQAAPAADSLSDLSISPFDDSITAKINALNSIVVGHLGGVQVSARKRRLSDEDSSPRVSRLSGSSDILSSLGVRDETPPAKKHKSATFTSLSSYIRKRRSRVPSPKQEKKAIDENIFKPTPFLQATRLAQAQPKAKRGQRTSPAVQLTATSSKGQRKANKAGAGKMQVRALAFSPPPPYSSESLPPPAYSSGGSTDGKHDETGDAVMATEQPAAAPSSSSSSATTAVSDDAEPASIIPDAPVGACLCLVPCCHAPSSLTLVLVLISQPLDLPPPAPEMSPRRSTHTPARKLKRLHWEKIAPSAAQNTLWNELGATSLSLDAQAIEALFGVQQKPAEPKTPGPAERKRSADGKVQLVEAKRSYNVDIALARFKLSFDAIRSALLFCSIFTCCCYV